MIIQNSLKLLSQLKSFLRFLNFFFLISFDLIGMWFFDGSDTG